MAKGTRGKSSASAATRKKQAAKAAAGSSTPGAPPAPHGGKRLSKKERQLLKKKGYVPPPKPPRPPPYPLDSLGLASLLPADLVVLLRKALKKDIVTRIRTLESLLAWTQGKAYEDQVPTLDDAERAQALVIMMPCWVHLFPRLALSPSQRLRLLTLQVHAELVRPETNADVRQELLSYTYIDNILGFWAVLVYDTSKSVARLAQALWKECVAWDGGEAPAKVVLADHVDAIVEHLRPILLSESASLALAQSTASLQVLTAGGETVVPAERDAKNRDETNVDESADELDARLVSGALGALCALVSQAKDVDEAVWEPFAESPTLWTALQSGAAPVPDSVVLGHDAPVVRQRAWAWFALLDLRLPTLVKRHFSTIVHHAFHGAFAETNVAVLSDMLAAFLPMLRRYPAAWEVVDDDDDDDDDASTDEPTEEPTSFALQFLRWLQLSGVQAPRVCFPAVLVFFSTMPPSVLPTTVEAANAALQPLIALAYVLVKSVGSIDPLGWDAYAAMVCECIAYLLLRIVRSDDPDEPPKAAALATELLSTMWDELVVGHAPDLPPIPVRFRVKTAREFGRCLAKLGVSVHGTPLWQGILAHMQHSVAQLDTKPDASTADADTDAATAMSAALTAALDAARAHAPPLADLEERVLALAGTLLQSLCEGAAASPRVLPILSHALSSPLGEASGAAKAPLRHVATTQAAQSASVTDATAFYEAYLTLCQGTDDADDVWTWLLAQSSPPSFEGLALLMRVAQHTPLPRPALLQPWQDAVGTYLGEGEVARDVALALLAASPALVGKASEHAVLRAAAAHIQANADAECIEALSTWHAYAPKDRSRRICEHAELQCALPAIYAAGHLHALDAARQLWTSLTQAAPAALDEHAVTALRAALLDGSAPRPRVLSAARQLGSAELGIMQILPDVSQFDAAMLLAVRRASSPLLYLRDPLAPLRSAGGSGEWNVLPTIVHALLAALETDRGLAAQVTWSIPHLLYFGMCLEDAMVLGDEDTLDTLLDGTASHDELASGDDTLPGAAAYTEPRRMLAEVQLQRVVHALTRLLSSFTSSLPDTWHAATAKAVASGVGADPLAAAVAKVWANEAHADDVYARLLARLLRGIFSLSSASSADVEPWIRLATEKTTPVAFRSALLCATRFAGDARAHDRARNELGAALGGIAPGSAGTEGLAVLHTLVCAAPPSEMGLALIPTQRAVFAVQAMQRWLAAEDELPEEAFVLLASVCVELAPVLQTVAGRPVDMMLDLVEENLAAADGGEPMGWPTLSASLRLLSTLYELRESEAVAAALASHRDGIHTALRDTFLRLCAAYTSLDARVNDVESEVLALLVRMVLTHVPNALFAEHTDALGALIQSETHAHVLHVAAYRLYSHAVRDMVREQVVEMAVMPDKAPVSLDPTLVQSLTRHPVLTHDVWDTPDARLAAFTYLLQWLAVLEHFVEASLALKSVYSATLQQPMLVSTQLLPSLFLLLGGAPRTQAVVRPLDLSRYDVEDVVLEEVHVANPVALQLLAAHVYFRTLVHLPTQVRDWFLSVRDRQLSLQVSHTTAKFCTPLLAARELRHLRDPDALARLEDESMAVKVLSSNEVVATYTVDEHPMEIGVRLPSDFPLHGVEIRDLKRVGVSEAQWRAWLLAVQQMLSGKNGLILDALMLFKKSAEAKFQGYEGAECAICYSIISPTDQTLPNKPCKTCKHRFHGSCLYKWVSTSGASTCPLCRSIL